MENYQKLEKIGEGQSIRRKNTASCNGVPCIVAIAGADFLRS